MSDDKKVEVVKPSNPSEWLKSLVEKNQEDTDFISMAHQTMQMLDADPSKEMETKLTTLEEENRNLKKKFYETFMGGSPSEIEVDEVAEKTTPSMKDILSTLERK